MRFTLLCAVLLASPTLAAAQEGAGSLTPPRPTASAEAGTSGPPAQVTGTADTDTADADTADTGTADTGTADTGTADTGTADTGTADTSAAHTVPLAPTLGDVPPPPDSSSAYTPQPSAPLEGVASDSPDLRIPSRTATRLRALDGSLGTLAARGGSVVDGILSMVTGGLSLGIGIYFHNDDRRLASYLYLWGVSGITRGVIDLALRPRASEPAIQFAHMPMGSMEEVEARLQFGENALQRLASRARLARILDASISVATGALVLPIYFIPNDFFFDDAFDYFVLIGAGISVITGVVALATRSPAERRWSAYEELRERLDAGEPTATLAAPRVQFIGAGVAPVEGGAALSATALF